MSGLEQVDGGVRIYPDLPLLVIILVPGSTTRLPGRPNFLCTLLLAVTNSFLPDVIVLLSLHLLSLILGCFYPINIGRRVLLGYECRTPSLVVVRPLPPPCRLASLAHVGIVDFCVYTYFTDRLRADDIWRIVVGFLQVSFF